MADQAFTRWMQALEERQLAGLRVQDITRALRALSSVYVERRDVLPRGAALDSAGKRAAFALFYGPLHYVLTRHVAEALGACRKGVELVVDIGCGTGAAGAAWATGIGETAGRTPRVLGIDRHPWAVMEARWTYRAMGLKCRVRHEDAARARLRGRRTAIVLAFTVTELPVTTRATLLPRIVRAVREGGRALLVEAVARSIGPWWGEWAETLRRAGGREDTWRVETELPERVRQLDRAAGLDHRVLTGRSLYVQASSPEP